MIQEGKVLVMDIDGTICPTKQSGESYADLVPDARIVERMRWYRKQGFHLILQTSRRMRTYGGNVGLINIHMLPELVEWLDRQEIPYDEIHVGKPWAGREGFYVDDRAVRPSEFLALSPEEVAERIAADSVCDA